MDAAPHTDQDELHAALTAVARAIASSLDLTEVWFRVADACRAVVPFDGMGIGRFEGENRARLIAVAGEPTSRELRDLTALRSDFSPTLWPDADDYLVLIDDAALVLDPSFEGDRITLGRGYKSLLRLPLGRDGKRYGSLILGSFQRARFTREHAGTLRLVAEMLTVALAHQELAEESSRAAAAQERANQLEERVQVLKQELEALSPPRHR